jgi:2-polyprenyl-3-methyl-5-hydroxy-6-metoxy-1,4-benzoquinol methylase
MMRFNARYGEVGETEAKYNVKPREDLLNLLDTRPTSILELGCADGTNLMFFRERLRLLGTDVERLVGVDSQRIRDCANYGAFEFIHSTVERFIDGCRERFDVIILSDVVEHLYNPWRTIASLRGNLTMDGRLLISVPNLQNVRYVSAVVSGRFYYEESGLMDVTHIRFFSAETLTSLVQGAGYAIRQTGYRPDFALSNQVGQWRKCLASGERPAVALGACTILVTEDNIELLSAQQLLVCASKVES